MRLRPGDSLRCSNAECRLQVIVTDIGSHEERDSLLRCFCGSPMKKVYVKPAASRLHLKSEAAKTGTPGTTQQ
jgi:hypothetical protein